MFLFQNKSMSFYALINRPKHNKINLTVKHHENQIFPGNRVKKYFLGSLKIKYISKRYHSTGTSGRMIIFARNGSSRQMSWNNNGIRHRSASSPEGWDLTVGMGGARWQDNLTWNLQL